MTKNDEFVITRILNAPRDRVFKAWTTTDEIKKWWGPKGFSCPEAHSDFRVGGKYRYCMLGHIPGFEGKHLWSGGVYEEIVPGKKIVCTDYFCDEHGNKGHPQDHGLSPEFPAEQTVTVLFEDEEDGKTRLSIHYPMPSSEAAREAMRKSGMNEGWNSSLDKLQELLE